MYSQKILYYFLYFKGLLQKDPSKRFNWSDILSHPFVAGHILILDEKIENNGLLGQITSNSASNSKEKQNSNYAIKHNLKPKK